MAQLRIALVSYEYPSEPGCGGIGVYTQQAACMLAGRGHAVEVFTCGRSSSVAEAQALIHRIPSAGRRLFHADILGVFRERHQERPFDIVEGPEYMADTLSIRQALPELPHAIRLHTPTFLVNSLFRGRVTLPQKLRFYGGGLLRGKLPKPFWKYEKAGDPEYQLARSVPFLLHPSKDIATVVQREWDIPGERFIHLPNPFQPPQALLDIPAAAKAGQEVRILFLGRLEKRKGVLTLLEVIPVICRKYPQARFVFTGRGSDMQVFLSEKLAAWDDRLEFTGEIPHDQIPQQLAKADICLFPSLWENFPNVCLEAMAAGRAIIGSKNGGMRDMLEAPPCGLLIDPERPATIVEALSTFLDNPGMRETFGERARQVVLERYNAGVIGAQTEAVYQKIIEQWPVWSR